MRKLRGLLLILGALGLAAVVLAQVPPGGYTALYTNKDQTITATHTFNPTTPGAAFGLGANVTCVPNPQVINASCPPYSAVGDNVTDNLPALTAAFAAAAGKTLYLPAGIYRLSNTITIGSGMTVVGDGGLLSELRSTSATLPTLKIASDSAVTVRGITFGAAVTKSAGSHLRILGSLGTTINSLSVIEDCRFLDYWIGVNVVAAAGLTLRGNSFNTTIASATGIFLDNVVDADQGDTRLIANAFNAGDAAATTATAILQIAAGGTQLISNKFHRHAYQYHLNARAGIVTGQLYIVGNSFDSFATTCLHIEGAGAYTAFVIANNIFTTCTNALVLDGNKQNGTITGNNFWSDAAMLNVITGTDWIITGNNFQNGTSAVNIGAGATRIKVTSNNYADVTTVLTNAGADSGEPIRLGYTENRGAVNTITESWAVATDSSNVPTCNRVFSSNPAYWWDVCGGIDTSGGGTKNGFLLRQHSGAEPVRKAFYLDENGAPTFGEFADVVRPAMPGTAVMVCVDPLTGKLYASNNDANCS